MKRGGSLLVFFAGVLLLLGLVYCVDMRAQSKVRGFQLSHQTWQVPTNYVAEPSNQTGDTFRIVWHNPAFALKVYVDGRLLSRSQYTLEADPNCCSFTIHLGAPLAPGSKIQWETWGP